MILDNDLISRVGHCVLLRSECIVLLLSFKAHKNVILRFFLKFLATYETQKNDAFFSYPLTTKNEKFANFRETSTACSSWYAEFRTFRIFEISIRSKVMENF